MPSPPAPNWFASETTLLDEIKKLRATPDKALAPTVPGYDDIAELRRGGQGVVYSAVQRSTRRRVAIKVLLDPAGSAAARRRFEREVDLVASLRHPRIVSVYDSGLLDDGRPFLVMEFVDGQPLDGFIASRGWSDRAGVKPTVDLLARVCEAVEFAHQRGVIHRDLKPSNIRVDDSGEPRVLDFGLAKPLLAPADAPDAPTAFSISGQFLGSLAWASPEQAAGAIDDIDLRSDVYSLGVMLFYALTNRFPYDIASGLRKTLDAIVSSPPARPSRHAPWIDDELETIVLKCLAKERERRYQSAGELARDLRRYLAGEPILAKTDSAWYLLRAAVRRHRPWFIAAAGAVVILAGLSIVMALLFSRARTAEKLADKRAQEAAAASHRAVAEGEEKAAVAGFLREMLATPDPASRGRDVKVIDVIDRAAARLNAPGPSATAPDSPPQDAGTAAEPAAPVSAPLSASVSTALCSTLGDTYAALGEWEKAAALQRRAYEGRIALLGAENPDTIRAGVALMNTLAHRSEFDEAERIADAVTQSFAKLPPEVRLSVGVLSARANLNYEHGRHEEAVRYGREALALAEQVRLTHPEVYETVATAIMGDLAVALRNMRQLDEAEALYKQVVARCRERKQTALPTLIKALISYGSLLQDRSRLDDAEALYKESLELCDRALGSGHSDTLICLNNLATLYLDRREYAKAEPLCGRAIELAREKIGPESSTTLTLMNTQGVVLENLNRLDEAEALHRQTIALRAKVLGPEHPHTLISMNNLAGVLSKAGRLDDAFALDQQILDIRRRTLGEENLDTLISLNNVGLQLVKRNRVDEALPLAQAAVNGARKSLKDDHWITGAFRGNLGRCLQKLGRLDEAEAELLPAYQTLKAKQGEKDKRTKQNAASLAEIYRAQGKAQQADQYEALSKLE